MTPLTLPNHKTIDASDDAYAAALRAAHAAYDKYLTSGANIDLHAWVVLDREVSAIRDARQREAQASGKEFKLRIA
jgi:hypothetical protein